MRVFGMAGLQVDDIVCPCRFVCVCLIHGEKLPARTGPGAAARTGPGAPAERTGSGAAAARTGPGAAAARTEPGAGAPGKAECEGIC
jgi:hypothetical protein